MFISLLIVLILSVLMVGSFCVNYKCTFRDSSLLAILILIIFMCSLGLGYGICEEKMSQKQPQVGVQK